MECKVKWLDGVSFVAETGSGHALVMDGARIPCSDRHGRLLQGTVQVIRRVELPPRSEVLIACRTRTDLSTGVGMIERREDGPWVARSITRMDTQGKVWLRCVNWTDDSQVLESGKTVAMFSCVGEEDIQEMTRPQ